MQNIKKKATQWKTYLTKTGLERMIIEATDNEEPVMPNSLLYSIADRTGSDQDVQTILKCVWENLKSPPKCWRKISKTIDLIETLVKLGDPRIKQEFINSAFKFRSLQDFSYREGGVEKAGPVQQKARQLYYLLSNREVLETESEKARQRRAKFVGISSDFTTGYGGSYQPNEFYRPNSRNLGDYAGVFQDTSSYQSPDIFASQKTQPGLFWSQESSSQKSSAVPNLFADVSVKSQKPKTNAVGNQNLFPQSKENPSNAFPDLFGQPTKQQNTSESSGFPDLFGQPAKNQNTPDLFAQNKPQSTPDLFGQNKSVEPKSTPDLFAQPQKTPDLFAETKPQKTPDLFAQPQKTPDLFAETKSQNTPNLFAETKPQNTPDLFTQPQHTPDLFTEPQKTPNPNAFADLFAQPTQPQSTQDPLPEANINLFSAQNTQLNIPEKPNLFKNVSVKKQEPSKNLLFEAQTSDYSLPSNLFESTQSTQPVTQQTKVRTNMTLNEPAIAHIKYSPSLAQQPQGKTYQSLEEKLFDFGSLEAQPKTVRDYRDIQL